MKGQWGYVLLLSITSWAALHAQVLVSPKLLEHDVPDDRVSVLMVLREQPQAEILAAVREEARSAVRQAAKHYRHLEALSVGESEMKSAEQELYNAIVASRQKVATQIAAATGPAQEALAARVTGLGGTRLRKYLALNMVAAEVPASALNALKTDTDLSELLPDPQDPARFPDVLTELDRTLFETAQPVLVAGWTDSEAVAHLLDRIGELYEVKIAPVDGSAPVREADLKAAADQGEWHAARAAPLQAALGPLADARGIAVSGGKTLVWTPSKVYLVDTVVPLDLKEILAGGSPIAGTQGIADAGIPIIWTTGHVYAVRTFVPLDVVEIPTPSRTPIAGAKGVTVASSKPVIWTATNVYFADTITPLTVGEILSPAGSPIAGVQEIAAVNGVLPIIRTATNVYFVKTFIPEVVEIRTPSGAPMAGARGITMVAGGSNPIIWTASAVYFVRTLTPSVTVEEIRAPGGSSITGTSGVVNNFIPIIWTPSNVWAVRTLTFLDLVEVRTPAGASMVGVQKVVVGAVPFMWTANNLYAIQNVATLNVVEILAPGRTSIMGTRGFVGGFRPLFWTAGNVYLVDLQISPVVTEVLTPGRTSISNVQGAVAVSGVIPIIWTPANVWLLRAQNDLVEIRTPSGSPIVGTRGVALGATPFIWTATNVYTVKTLNPVDVLEIVVSGSGAGGGCSYAISPASATILAAGSPGNVAVRAPAGCAWTAVSNAAWITIAPGASGNGSGTVLYSVGANTGPARTGTLTIAGQPFTVTQQAPAVVPLTAQMQAAPPLVVGHTAAALIADLTITFTGGTTGQSVSFNTVVFLNVPVAVPDAPVLTTPGGAAIWGVRTSANAWVFSNVPLVQPGPGGTAVYRITNMKANTLSAPAGSTVMGMAWPTGTRPIKAINTTTPVSVLALVQ